MLFTYTPEALTENWLNPTIVHILRVGMQNILEGHELPAWPDMIPVARRNALRRRSGIRKRLANFWTQFIALDREFR